MKQRKPARTLAPVDPAACSHAGHTHGSVGGRPAADPAALDRAARLFRAMGDGPRLRLLHLLAAGEGCVTELVEDSGRSSPPCPSGCRVLRSEGLVARRRVGLHVYYSLADRHVADLVANALAHAGELNGSKPHSQEAD
ncbi:MAG: helix-turn-helix domain-containing protein [Gemmataceae bacterium]